MVDTRVETNFIHDNDASGFYSILKRPDRWRDVTCRDDVCVTFDGSFNDRSMEGVGDKRNDCIHGCDGSLERRGISDVKGYGRRVRKALRQRFCALERATSCVSFLTWNYEGQAVTGRTDSEFVSWIADYVLSRRTGDEATSKEEHFLSWLIQIIKSSSSTTDWR